MSSDIPEARLYLMAARDVLKQMPGSEAFGALLMVDCALSHMHRRRPTRRAAVKSEPMSDQLREEIRLYARQRPDAHLQTIANEFGVNPGRVSEALAN